MWELDCDESWAPKNWCFWTVVLEKTLESPLDCKEISPGISLEGMMLKLKLQYFGHLMWRVDSLEKTMMLGGIGGKAEKGTTEDEMAGWHHWLDGCESEWTPGVGDGQGGLACCDLWGSKESDTMSDWAELNWTLLLFFPQVYRFQAVILFGSHHQQGLSFYSFFPTFQFPFVFLPSSEATLMCLIYVLWKYMYLWIICNIVLCIYVF